MKPPERITVSINSQDVPVIIGEDTTDRILDAARQYDSVVLVTGSSAADRFASHIPDLDGIRGELTKITLNEGDNLKNVRNYQKIVKVLIDRNASQDSLIIAVGCGEVLDLSGFVAATYRGGTDYVPVPTTLLAQVSNSVSGLAGINFSSHDDVICSRATPTEVIEDSFYSKSGTNDEMKDGIAEMIRYGIVADHSIISMMQSLEDLKAFRQSDAMCRLISKSLRLRTEFVSTQKRNGRGLMNFGLTMGNILGEIFHDRVPYGSYIATGMFLELFLAERSGISVKDQRERISEPMEKFGIRRSLVKEAGLDNVLKKINEHFPGDNAVIKLHIPLEVGVGQEIDISKDRMFSLLRSYTELYEFNPS